MRQVLAAAMRRLTVGVVNFAGRVDAFTVEEGACHIKYSTKRLSPWQFTYTPENLVEIQELSSVANPVWLFFVCGGDGIVGISREEMQSVLPTQSDVQTWVRIRRSKNGMYRVIGPLGECERAKPRGVQPFLDAVLRTRVVRAGQ